MACVLINCCIISAKAIDLYFKPCWAIFVAYLSRFSIITVIVEILLRDSVSWLTSLFWYVYLSCTLNIFNLWQQNYLLFSCSKLFCKNYRNIWSNSILKRVQLVDVEFPLCQFVRYFGDWVEVIVILIINFLLGK